MMNQLQRLLLLSLFGLVACKPDPGELRAKHAPTLEKGIASVASLLASAAKAPPKPALGKIAATLDLRRTSFDSNGLVIDTRQRDPKWPQKAIEYRYEFRSSVFAGCRAELARSKAAEGEALRKLMPALRRCAKRFDRLRYLIAVTETAYEQPQVSDRRFTAGRIAVRVHVYRLPDKELVGAFDQNATIARKAMTVVYRDQAKRERYMRNQLGSAARDALHARLARSFTRSFTR